MKTEELNYELPAELIAQQPSAHRSDSKLLVFDRGGNKLSDSCFSRLGDFLRPGDCLVLNDTKVLPARFFGHRQTGGKLEGLFLSQGEDGLWNVMLKGSRKVKVGEIIYLDVRDTEETEMCKAELVSKSGSKCLLKIDSAESAEAVLERIGFPPLPPYIKRTDDAQTAAVDMDRYQTVYAQKAGAVAAPTAGLHFTNELIVELKEKGVLFANVTLHVGAGTFKPVTEDNLEDHQIHKEWFSIDDENASIINLAKQKNGRIIAVGTTSVRTLETVALGSTVEAANGMTEIFITPGYKFKLVDAIITNFHLPKSTLLSLVAAFAGLEETLAAYKHATENRYRFYSYGDVMFIC